MELHEDWLIDVLCEHATLTLDSVKSLTQLNHQCLVAWDKENVWQNVLEGLSFLCHKIEETDKKTEDLPAKQKLKHLVWTFNTNWSSHETWYGGRTHGHHFQECWQENRYELVAPRGFYCWDYEWYDEGQECGSYTYTNEYKDGREVERFSETGIWKFIEDKRVWLIPQTSQDPWNSALTPYEVDLSKYSRNKVYRHY